MHKFIAHKVFFFFLNFQILLRFPFEANSWFYFYLRFALEDSLSYIHKWGGDWNDIRNVKSCSKSVTKLAFLYTMFEKGASSGIWFQHHLLISSRVWLDVVPQVSSGLSNMKKCKTWPLASVLFTASDNCVLTGVPMSPLYQRTAVWDCQNLPLQEPHFDFCWLQALENVVKWPLAIILFTAFDDGAHSVCNNLTVSTHCLVRL